MPPKPYLNKNPQKCKPQTPTTRPLAPLRRVHVTLIGVYLTGANITCNPNFTSTASHTGTSKAIPERTAPGQPRQHRPAHPGPLPRTSHCRHRTRWKASIPRTSRSDETQQYKVARPARNRQAPHILLPPNGRLPPGRFLVHKTENNLIADSPIGRINIFANGKDAHVLFLKEEARK